ncbi:MAG: MBOAT family O-acyltransferase [Planctomycetota bacterium]
MNFNSLEYGVFLLVVVALYWAITQSSVARRTLLLIASYIFYMSWSSYYAGLILFSTLVDFQLGRWMAKEESEPRRRVLLIISLVTNLGLLFVFKYFNFFVETGEQIVSLFGTPVEITRSRLLLPVGISFYTFQTLSYTIDLYRRKLNAETSFLNFAVFVSFFPQLVAGPIVRAVDFLPQMTKRPRMTTTRFHAGILRILQGLIKKVIFADLLAALLVDDVFANPKEFGTIDHLLALYGYAFQIYNDFSGYSDIAIGSAMLLGFQLPENFDRPYIAKDVREFWSRWHITLSTWLRDYLYIPLGGNRRGERRTTMNLMLTMILGGLWHGASMNFVLWGVYHGLLLVLAHRFTSMIRSGAARVFLCFHLVLLGWLLFRIESLSSLSDFGSSLISGNWLPGRASYLFMGILILASMEHFVQPERLAQLRTTLAAKVPSPVLGFAYAMILLLLVGATVDAPSFLYFQF